jgi:hypothetical protein
VVNGIGVDAGFSFAGEPEAGWPGAVTRLEAKARIIRRTTRIKGCMEQGVRGPPDLFFAFIDLE